jgi:integrase
MVVFVVIAGRGGGAVAMPVRRDPRTGRWFFRATVQVPDGTRRRVFGTPGVAGPYQNLAASKVGAQEAERRAIAEIMNGKPARAIPQTKEEVQTFKEFAEGFYMDKMRTTGNQKLNKPATLNAKECHLRIHLLPTFGSKPLDRIDADAIEDFKIALAKRGRKPKTINNVIMTLHNILKNARKRKLIAALPEVEWLTVGEQGFDFLDFDEAERLVAGAAKEPDWWPAVLLALKSGMRLGELRALRWSDVDLVAGTVQVRRNLWRDHEGTPKSGRTRTIDLPASAVAALKSHRHLRGERVFLNPGGRDYRKRPERSQVRNQTGLTSPAMPVP